MRTRSVQLSALIAVSLPTFAYVFGGWSVITVDDLPQYVVAGQPFKISYVVRQHGMHVLTGYESSVSATKTGASDIRVTAVGGAQRNVASVTLPAAGDWTLTIRHAFVGSRSAPLSLRAIDSSAPPPAPMTPAALGLRLFVAKGCNTCHTRAETSNLPGGDFGPQLTGKRYVPDVLAGFLANPDSSPLSKSWPITNYVRMPNLELKPAEITALVAYLNSSPPVAASEKR